MDYNKLIFVEEYFRSNRHDFTRDNKIESLRKKKNALDNIRAMKEAYKNKWI